MLRLVTAFVLGSIGSAAAQDRLVQEPVAFCFRPSESYLYIVGGECAPGDRVLSAEDYDRLALREKRVNVRPPVKREINPGAVTTIAIAYMLMNPTVLDGMKGAAMSEIWHASECPYLVAEPSTPENSRDQVVCWNFFHAAEARLKQDGKSP